MSVRTGQGVTHGNPQHPCQAVGDVVASSARRAVIVTELAADVVQRFAELQGCGDVPVVHLDTGDPDGVRLQDGLLRGILARDGH